MFGLTAPDIGGTRVLGLAGWGIRAARAGLGWWLGELRGLLPDRVHRLVAGTPAHLVLRLTSDGLVVEEPTPGGTLLPDGAAVPLHPELRTRIAGASGGILMLPPHLVLRRAVELPLAAAHELDGAVLFLIERYTPFIPDQVRHTFRVLARDRARKVVRIELAVVPCAMLDGPLAAAAAHGIPIVALRVENDEGVPLLDLLGRGGQSAERDVPWRRNPWKPMLAAAAALLVLGPPLVAARVHVQADALAAEVDAAAPAGRRGAVLQQEVQAQARAAAFLPARLRGPHPVEVLAALTRALPDDTWLFSIEVEPNEVRMAGYSPDVPALLERLQTLPIVDAPELRGPVVHGAGGRDRFETGFRLKPPAP